MAKYQNKKSELSKRRFLDIFGDLPKKTQIKLVKSLSEMQKEMKL